jgi:putative two-component system response regulator
MMPEMDGYEMCRRLKEDSRLKDIPVIFLSALSETADKIKAFGAGGVDYVTKPFHFEEVRARVETHLRLHRLQQEVEGHNLRLQQLVQAQVKEICDSQMAAIFALSNLAESRDGDTGKHLERIQVFCRLLAEQMSLQPRYQARFSPGYVENLFHASPMHDIGKVGIADEVLCKPGPLTAEEFEVMKQHSLIGARTLEAARSKYPKNAFINMGIAIARSHHEKWQGGGYPDGLMGEDIPLCARIMAVADCYDALRSPRCYKPPLPHEKAKTIILEECGRQFDPSVVEAFDQTQTRFQEIREAMND